MARSSFKLGIPLEKRRAEAARVREKYPDTIPVIVEKAGRSNIVDIDRNNLFTLFGNGLSFSAERAIFVFVKGTLPSTGALMSVIYEHNKDEDGFLYMSYSGENTFGGFLGGQ